MSKDFLNSVAPVKGNSQVTYSARLAEMLGGNHDTWGWTGNGLPMFPVIEFYDDSDDVLFVTPGQTTVLLQMLADSGQDDDVVLEENYQTPVGVFNIMLSKCLVYVLDNDDIIGLTEKEKAEEFEKYMNVIKDFILNDIDMSGCKDNAPEIVSFYENRFANADLLKDEDYIKFRTDLLSC